MKKTISILGATGSIGQQALDLVRAGKYNVDFITAARNSAMAERIVREFRPKAVAMADIRAAHELKFRLRDTSVKILAGEAGICEGISESSSDTVLNAILGRAGLAPTLATIEAGKRLALANKESLVIAGEIVMGFAKKLGAEIIPVDSEHSAIFQSLSAGKASEVKKLILTASGGPFYGMSREQLSRVTLADTLAHPTWKMGEKITVDSATLMNKGFEVIEAAHLFNMSPDKIEVVVHRESVLHSAVEYIDNSIIGEFSVPDMRMCIQYAIDYPDRNEGRGVPLSLTSIGKMTFANPDEEAFPLLQMARRSFFEGGGCPAVLNAADEIAVDAFLKEKIRFADISTVIMNTYEMMRGARYARSVQDILSADEEARKIALQYTK